MGTATAAMVLSAEDDDDHYMLIQTALEEYLNGHKLKRAIDGEDLLNQLREEKPNGNHHAKRPDLILLDLNMPKKTGIEALREIRSDGKLHLIPVVIFSVSSDEKDIRACYELGANSFITKPDDFQEYINTVKRMFQYWIETSLLPTKKN